MVKAKICVFDEDDKIIKVLEVMFIQEEYLKSNSKNGFCRNTLTLLLFFDSYEEKADVREDHETRDKRTVIGTKRIFELVIPMVPGKNGKQPPVCMFVWGKFCFKGVVQQVEEKFTMFLPDGVPCRAYVIVKLKNILNLKDALN